MGMQRREQSFLNSGTWRSIPEELVFFAGGTEWQQEGSTLSRQRHRMSKAMRKSESQEKMVCIIDCTYGEHNRTNTPKARNNIELGISAINA